MRSYQVERSDKVMRESLGEGGGGAALLAATASAKSGDWEKNNLGNSSKMFR